MRGLIVCSVVVVVLLVVQVTGRLHCPAGWKLSNGNCYKFVQCNNKDECYINKAARLCATVQGKATLASVRSLEHNTFIAKLAPAHIADLFIGGQDGLKEGEWRWPDASFAGYTNWNTANKEPNNCCGGENCVTMVKHWKYQWNDASCTYKYNPGTTGYVCERGADC